MTYFNAISRPCSVCARFIMSAAFVASGLVVNAAIARDDIARSNTTEVSSVDLDAIWNDPIFKKQFIGGYGMNAAIEPRIMKKEVAILEKVRPLMADNLSGAQAALQAEMKPDCSAILDFTLGGIYFQQDQLEQALACYNKAVEKFPTFRRAYRNIGLITVRRLEFDAAISAFNRMIELGGADAYSYGLLAFAHSSKQDFQPAEAAYRNALLLQPSNTEWRLGLTRCVFKEGKYEDAVALLDVLITQFPEKAEFWLLQSYAYLGMKQPTKAAINLESLDVLGASTLDSLYTLGDIYMSEALPQLALGAYTRAVALTSKQPLARSMHAAEVLASRGAGVEARTLVTLIRSTWSSGSAGSGAVDGATDGAITLSDDDTKKLLKLDARLSMAQGGGDASTALVLEEILQLDPLDGEALMLLGQHYARQNQPDRAMLAYERAAGIEQFAPNAKVRQAQILVSQSRFTDAIALLRQSQDLKPREDVARYLEQIERLAKSRR